MSYFEKTTPEAVGLRSGMVLKFLEEVEKEQIELHSLMIVRNGKCCVSGWWAPYGPEDLHPLCSFSKSLTSIAVGFAEQEGLLTLDEKIADIFPEYLPEHPGQNLRNATLHHFLTMSCGHDTDPEAMGEDWIKEFLSHPFLHEPGTFYRYNTSGTNMLAAVIKRKTGQNVTEYLRPRLLDPLGIREIYCECLPGTDPVEIGGGGMKLRTEDMAKFAWFLLKKGKWEGKQLLRESWFARACSKQIETEGGADGFTKEWGCGYGYQIWMNSYPGSFRADGAYGQFGIVFPDLDMIVVTTSATKKTQELIDLILRDLLPSVENNQAEEAGQTRILAEKLASLALPPLRGDRQPEAEEQIDGRIYAAVENEKNYCSGLELLVGGVALYHVEEGITEKMSFTFSQDKVVWSLWGEGKKKEITGDFRQHFHISKCGSCFYGASAGWLDKHTLQMEIRRLDAISGARITFRFGGSGLTMESQDTLLDEREKVIGMRKKHTVPFFCIQ